MKKVSIYFSNGLFLEAKAFSGVGTHVGEIVFNTSLSGYQEIITDPSYSGQFITFSMPQIGIVGSNDLDFESNGIFCRGVIVRDYQNFYSNFRAQKSLKDILESKNILGICEIDTRSIVKMIRKCGAMMMIASTEIHNKNELKDWLSCSTPIEKENHIINVSTKNAYTHKHGRFNFELMNYETPKTKHNIVAIDFGIKRNILNELVNVGLNVEVIPHSFKADTLIERFNNKEIEGIFLSNGPGDPKFLEDEINEIKKLINAKIPMFGICLGHQLLSIAHGYQTEKLPFGHHGGNHPVKNLKENSIEITAQNHIYSVPESIEEIAEVTHRNLFDNTIEGVKYKNASIFSIQHHPEASPGPQESTNIFKEFVDLLENNK